MSCVGESVKKSSHSAFYVLIFRASLLPHLQQIFILLFQRLSSSKTTKYIKGDVYCKRSLWKFNSCGKKRKKYHIKVLTSRLEV